MYNYINEGKLIKDDPYIARPQLWAWTPSSHGQAIADANSHSRVYLGLRGGLEITASEPCEIGRWGTSDAPDWPSAWEDHGFYEPEGSFSLLGIVLINGSSKPVGTREDGGTEVDTWGHIKEMGEDH